MRPPLSVDALSSGCPLFVDCLGLCRLHTRSPVGYFGRVIWSWCCLAATTLLWYRRLRRRIDLDALPLQSRDVFTFGEITVHQVGLRPLCRPPHYLFHHRYRLSPVTALV